MAENVGDIVYTVSADIDPFVSSSKQLDKQVDGIAKSTKKADSSLGNLSRSAGQAGIQIQQLVGQIQGGQSVFGALSAQAADLGVVLGAPLLGAVAGLSASFAGALLPALFDSDDATEQLKETLESLSKVVIQNEQGINVLSNSFANLAKKSSEIARAQLALSITEATQAINLSKQAAIDAAESFDALFNGFEVAARGLDSLDEAQSRTGRSIADLIDNTDAYGTGITQLSSFVSDLNDEFGTTSEQSVKLIRAFDNLQTSSEPTAINDFAKAVTDVSLNANNATPELQKFTVDVNKLSLQSASAQEVLVLLEKAFKDLDGTVATSSEEIDNARASIERYAEQLSNQAAIVGKSKSEALSYQKALALQKATQAAATQETKDSISASFDKLIADAKATEAAKDQAEADREAAKAKRDKARAEKEEQRAQQAGLSAAVQASPALTLGFGQENELAALQATYEAGLIAEQEYTAQKLAINQDYEEQIRMLQEERFRRESEGNALILDSLDALASSGTNAITGLLDGTTDLQGALYGIANTIRNQLIGALVEIGVQQLKNAVIGETAAAASVAAGTATGAALSAAYGPAATLASIATFGAAATTGATAVTAALAQTQALSFAGGRETGGPVSSGSFYRMGEGNKPEVLQTSSGLYGVPGDNGRVFNSQQLDQIGGSNGGFNIQIISEPGTVVTTVSQDDRQAIIRAAVSESVGTVRSEYSQSMNDRTGAYFNGASKNYGQGKASGRGF